LPWLLARFLGMHPFPTDDGRAGDVVYHLGSERVVHTQSGPISVALLPNPSHLEAVNAVALGRTRAVQDLSSAPACHALALILHTDASVIAQGVVAECLQLSGVPSFSTGGALHVIVNNQIGFTTEPSEARTSRYCTGAWKAIDSAILHVNGEDPEAVLRSADIAVEFRQAVGKDAVIDLVCYRRNGHNELDEPRFTQPVLYKSIDEQPSVRSVYEARLVGLGDIEMESAARIADEYLAGMQRAFQHMESGDFCEANPPAEFAEEEASVVTGVTEARLRLLLQRLSDVPNDLKINRKVERMVRHRLESADSGLPWASAEALAFATLLTEGVAVRLSGQDCVRGTFSHRHLALTDVATGRRYVSLDNLAEGQARFYAVNSPLSEYAVLAFEYGYSLGNPKSLVVWEAQFGDFANGAQIVIDQFIASGEEKWLQQSGLVILLPHGLEGQGPEHSSARIERLLLLGAGDNMIIANPSTPANYFHLLRRQALATRKKPLFITSPKTLLRLKAAVSRLSDLAPSESFRPVIVDQPSGPARRVLLCSGKIAYDLLNERNLRKEERVAIVRIETLYPPPLEALQDLFIRWPEAQLCWVQEEAANMGAWPYLARQFQSLVESLGPPSRKVECVSRPESASPAGSFHSRHFADQEALVQRAFAAPA
jgi:2-oxoglutarate dehydrogenase E1 component